MDAHLKLEFPFFVKAVKATISLMARTVTNFDDLERDCDFLWIKKIIGRVAVTPFNQMLNRYTDYDLSGHYFITEELLHTNSFERFDYPFSVVNVTRGLTPMRIWTFFWVSEIGMWAGTAAFVNAGRELGHIDRLGDIGSPSVILSFAPIGALPLLLKKGFFRLRPQ